MDDTPIPQWAHDRAAAKTAMTEAKARLNEAHQACFDAERRLADAFKAQADWEQDLVERAIKAAE